jgi:DNA-binding CsgD family transcriptional regulator
LLEESLALSREAGYREGIAWSLNELGIVAYRQGDLGRADASLEESLRVHHDLGDRWRIASVLEGLAGTACARGEFELAARIFGAAEALREAIGTPVPLCERPDRDSNVATARARLDDAAWAALWAEGQAMSLGEAVGYALAEGSASPAAKARAEAQPSALTRRQWEIAQLIARGMTSREIAAHLTLSEHTVNTHVSKILSRLDLRSRTRLAAWVTERQMPDPG